jgi:hypothetical protein
MDGVARYCAASAAGDMDALTALLADDARLVPPLSGRMTFTGKADLGVLLGAVHAVLEDLPWTPVPGRGRRAWRSPR